MKGDGCIVISDEEMLAALTYWFTEKTWTKRELGTFTATNLKRCEHQKRPHWKISYTGEPGKDALLVAASKMPNKIEAIKYVRNHTGMDLKAAKAAVDGVWKESA